MKIQIYHYNKCTTSRKVLAALEKAFGTAEIEVIEYMKTPITFDQLKSICILLSLNSSELIRTRDKTWKEKYQDHELSADELIYLMIEYPSMMKRPILIFENDTEGEKKAYIATTKNIESILSQVQ